MTLTMRLWVLLVLVMTACVGAPVRGQQSKRAEPPVDPVLEGKVPREGFDLHYRIVGRDGPYVIILSGGPGATVEFMKPVADELKAKYRCVMLEQRGTGRSKLKEYTDKTINYPAYIADVEALRVHLKGDKLILFGNSWGMMLAFAYGGAHPERVRAIITMGSGPIKREYGHIYRDNLEARISLEDKKKMADIKTEFQERVKKGEKPDFNWVMARARKLDAAVEFFDRELGRKYADTVTEDDLNIDVYRLMVGRMPTDDFVHAKLSRITAPVLMIQGRQDVCPEENVFEAQRLLKNAQIKFINRCGHTPFLEQPKEAWKAAHEFLGKLKD